MMSAELPTSGIGAAAVPQALAELRQGVAWGWYTGAQLFASIRGDAVADLAFGEARSGIPMTANSIVEWASATKAVTCSAAAKVWSQGAFGLDDRVSDHIQRFVLDAPLIQPVHRFVTPAAIRFDKQSHFVHFHSVINVSLCS